MRFRSIGLIYTCVALSGMSILAAACSSDSTSGGPSSPAGKVTALRGLVTSTAGTPLAGVTVQSGKVTAKSDTNGRYDLRPSEGKQLVRFSLAGHVDGFRSVSLLAKAASQLDIALLPLAAKRALDASAGGMVEGSRGATVKVPAGAFIDADGAAVSGMVDVYLTPLDPSTPAERAAAPDFVAAAESGSEPALLESFGMVDISVRKGDEKLSVAPGKELELAIPVPEGVTPEPTMDLWSFDETKGIWVNEGEATYDPDSRRYIGVAKHMSFWNIDQVYSATCLCGIVREGDSGPLPGARIEASGVDYFGTTSSHAGSDGKFCVAVRKDSDVEVAAYHASTGGQSRRVHSGDDDTIVPPKLDDARCLDAGTWRVDKDVFVDSSGAATRCGDMENPFASGCASELGEVFGSCYDPAGACTLSFGGTSTTTRYANGARSEGSIAGSRLYSSSGRLCLTATFDMASAESIQIDYELPNGKKFSISVGAEGTGDYVIACPDGKETRVTAAQQQALQACTAPAADESAGGEQCTIEGGSVPDGGIGIPTSCTMNSECGDSVCCAVPSSTTKLCLPDSVCKLVQEQG